jgi:CTP:molybdopterin cytidylyltransferase MocA
MNYSPTILLLAAGRGARMGQPKALLTLDQTPLVRRALHTIEAAHMRSLTILGAAASEVAASLRADQRAVTCDDWARGMGASLSCGARALPDDHDAPVGVMVVDQLHIGPDHLVALSKTLGDDPSLDAAATTHIEADGQRVAGVPALFSSRCLPMLRGLTGDQGARHLLRGGALRVKLVEAADASDIDSPAQWAAALTRVSVALIAALCLLAPSGAAAQSRDPHQQAEAPFSFGPQAGWSVMTGLETGGGFGSAGGGFLLGGEVSVTRLMRQTWFGLYGDAVWDFGQGAALITAGPQLGFAFVGLDGGVAWRPGEQSALGGAGRLVLTAGFFSIYLRYMYVQSGVGAEHLGQAGVMFKLPAWSSK